MKTRLFVCVSLLFASPLVAQQPEPAPGSELAKLRQGYVDSLNRLLQQCVKSDDVMTAIAVSQELDKMARATPDAPPEMSPCGSWRWQNAGLITIAANGITFNTVWKTKGVWHWIDEPKRQFQIEWQDGFVDKLTVSPDGTKLQVVNSVGAKFMAERLPPPEKVVTDASPK